jgi:RNA polymerase sigma factor (sigma-70 family)
MNDVFQMRTEGYIPTRYSLLSRLQNWDDQESWRCFFDTYWRLIYSFALKSGLTEAEAEDVVQETVICVAKDIHKFRRNRQFGSFKGWLRNLTRWRIADQLRKRLPNQVDGCFSSSPDSSLIEFDEISDAVDAGFEDIWEAEWQSNLMDAALERVRRHVKEEHYQMFDLNVVKLWPAGKVARTLRVSVAQVYLAKHRILALLKKEVRRLENQW